MPTKASAPLIQLYCYVMTLTVMVATGTMIWCGGKNQLLLNGTKMD